MVKVHPSKVLRRYFMGRRAGREGQQRPTRNVYSIVGTAALKSKNAGPGWDEAGTGLPTGPGIWTCSRQSGRPGIPPIQVEKTSPDYPYQLLTG